MLHVPVWIYVLKKLRHFKFNRHLFKDMLHDVERKKLLVIV